MGICHLREEPIRAFSTREHESWRALYDALEANRRNMAHPIFVEGLQKLEITRDGIPDLVKVSDRLWELTGWRGVPVSGLERGESFYPALARREFPVGNFIRDRESFGYTAAPDVFHDIYGHIPFLANPHYADFCQAYGKMATKYISDPVALKKIERFFWFTVEFSLCDTDQGRRIFGGGILSSRDESLYSLSNKPQVDAFDVAKVCAQDFRIDQIQPQLFELKRPEQLYRSLERAEQEIISHRIAPVGTGQTALQKLG